MEAKDLIFENSNTDICFSQLGENRPKQSVENSHWKEQWERRDSSIQGGNQQGTIAHPHSTETPVPPEAAVHWEPEDTRAQSVRFPTTYLTC